MFKLLWDNIQFYTKNWVCGNTALSPTAYISIFDIDVGQILFMRHISDPLKNKKYSLVQCAEKNNGGTCIIF